MPDGFWEEQEVLEWDGEGRKERGEGIKDYLGRLVHGSGITWSDTSGAEWKIDWQNR